MASRTENSIRNTSAALFGQAATIILSFVTQTVFIRTLGAGYLGINGLFTNILQVLSFAELGFGTAIVYELYKPLEQKDSPKIAAVMNFYALVYRLMGIFILVAGCALIPFLSVFINDVSEIPKELPPLWVVYLAFLINTASSYFFNYKRSLVIASQNGHLNSLNSLLFNLIKNALQIFLLIAFRQYMPYLLIQIVCTLLGNISISLKADKLFPGLKKHKDERLSKAEQKGIFKNVLAMSCHKLGSVVVSGTDNILISSFVGVIATGYYSNYVLVTNTVRSVYSQAFNAVTASVGNLVAAKSREDSYKFYKKLLFVNAAIAIFCTTCLWNLVDPFIKIAFGSEYVMGRSLVALILFNFYITCMRQANEVYINTNGLFWQIKWKSIIEAGINLVASLIFVWPLKMGVFGIVLGTTCSTLFTNFWWEPYTVYKHAFSKRLSGYFALFAKYTVAMLVSVIVAHFACAILPGGILWFVVRAIISAAVPVAAILIFFGRSEEFEIIKSVYKKVLAKKSKLR